LRYVYLFIYYEIVHEYTIKKKKEKVKLSSTQKINHAINVLAVEKKKMKVRTVGASHTVIP